MIGRRPETIAEVRHVDTSESRIHLVSGWITRTTESLRPTIDRKQFAIYKL